MNKRQLSVANDAYLEMFCTDMELTDSQRVELRSVKTVHHLWDIRDKQDEDDEDGYSEGQFDCLMWAIETTK